MTAQGWDATYARAGRFLGRPLGKTDSLLVLLREVLDAAEQARGAASTVGARTATVTEFSVSYCHGSADVEVDEDGYSDVAGANAAISELREQIAKGVADTADYEPMVVVRRQRTRTADVTSPWEVV